MRVSGRAALAACGALAVVGAVAVVSVASGEEVLPFPLTGLAPAPAETGELFAAPVRYWVAGPKPANPPNGIVVADLNGDRAPDMAAGLDGIDVVPGKSWDLLGADVDGDSDVDLVIGDISRDRIVVLRNTTV